MKKEDDDWKIPAITGNYVKKMGADGLKVPQSIICSTLMHPPLFLRRRPCTSLLASATIGHQITISNSSMKRVKIFNARVPRKGWYDPRWVKPTRFC